MNLKPVRYSPTVENRINKIPKLLDKTDIESNIYWGTKIMDKGERFYIIYTREKSKERRIKNSVKIYVYFMDYEDKYYVNQIHIEVSY